MADNERSPLVLIACLQMCQHPDLFQTVATIVRYILYIHNFTEWNQQFIASTH